MSDKPNTDRIMVPSRGKERVMFALLTYENDHSFIVYGPYEQGDQIDDKLLKTLKVAWWLVKMHPHDDLLKRLGVIEKEEQA